MINSSFSVSFPSTSFLFFFFLLLLLAPSVHRCRLSAVFIHGHLSGHHTPVVGHPPAMRRYSAAMCHCSARDPPMFGHHEPLFVRHFRCCSAATSAFVRLPLPIPLLFSRCRPLSGAVLVHPPPSSASAMVPQG